MSYARLIVNLFCLLIASGSLCACQSLPAIDTPADISRATLIDSAIAWDAREQPIDIELPATGSLSITQTTTLAIRNSPELAAALWKVRQAQAEARQGRLLPNPILTLTVRFVEGGGKPAIEASLAEDLLSLFWRGQKISSADDKLRAASADALALAINTVEQAQEQYLATAIVDEELAVFDQRRALLERMLDVANKRLKAGEGTRLDTTTLEAQLVELEADRADRAAERTQQRLTLARMIGQPSSPADWKLELPPAATAPIGPEKPWIATALQMRPEIQTKRWELASLGEDLAIARWGIWEGGDVGVMSQRDPDWQVGPSISLPAPIFDDGRAKIDKAYAARMQLVHELLGTQRQVIEEVRKAHAALIAARAAAAKIGNQLLPLIERRREQAEAAYRAGDTDLTTLLLAEDSLATTQAKWVELREKAAVAEIKLERAAGGSRAAHTIAGTQPTTQPTR